MFSNKNNVTIREDVSRAMTYLEADNNFRELKNVIDDATITAAAAKVVAAGYSVIRSFEEGATLANPGEALVQLSNQRFYVWQGGFPKTVGTGSTPASTGGIGAGAWLDVTNSESIQSGNFLDHSKLINRNSANSHTAAAISYSGGTVESRLNALGNASNRNVAVVNGVAPLDANAKVPAIHLPDSFGSGVRRVGTWNASTNTPALPAANANTGAYYEVSTQGTFNSVLYRVGDWVVSNGSSWNRVVSNPNVQTVNGKGGGAVSLNYTDLGLGTASLLNAGTASGVATLDSSTRLPSSQLPTSAVQTSGNYTVSGSITFSQTISGSISGNAGTATRLLNDRTINGITFNGTANITLPTLNTTGDQSAAGIKTFTGAIAITGTAKAAGRLYGGSSNPTNATRLNYDGYFYATRLYAISSLRYKNVEYVDSLDESLRRVIEIGRKGVSVGHYKTHCRNQENRLNRWLIAEEVAKVSEEVVSKDTNGLIGGMDYNQLIPDLYAAVAKQQEIIETLLERVAVLEGK
jgi:hypothetical protein